MPDVYLIRRLAAGRYGNTAFSAQLVIERVKGGKQAAHGSADLVQRQQAAASSIYRSHACPHDRYRVTDMRGTATAGESL